MSRDWMIRVEARDKTFRRQLHWSRALTRTLSRDTPTASNGRQRKRAGYSRCNRHGIEFLAISIEAGQ
jgi:hypothetical protein